MKYLTLKGRLSRRHQDKNYENIIQHLKRLFLFKKTKYYVLEIFL